MKKCRKCWVEKDLSEFPKALSYRDGHRLDCKVCYNKLYTDKIRKKNTSHDYLIVYQRRMRSKKRKLINDAKDIPCTDCWIKYPPYVMDLDHLWNKEFNISKWLIYSYDRIVAEIAKCEVVCANCHRIRTHSRLLKKHLVNNT